MARKASSNRPGDRGAAGRLSALGRWAARAALLAGALFVAYELSILARIVWWRDHDPGSTAFMQARLDKLREKKPEARLKHQWVPYARISSNLKRAVVAAEDAKFSDHEGFDWEAMQKAWEKNQQRGKVVAGGSTISQQLAKNLFLSGERTPWRKAQEAMITVMLENAMDKRRILEIYLNVIEWGDGVFGAEAAARHYFGTSAAALGPEQAARLAAMVPNPRFYDRNRRTPWLERKTQIVLARMSAAEVP
jgi:monofunctional glycosyltransferase